MIVPMASLDVYWLAGLLEGEGSFMAGPPSAPNQPRITVAMTDEDIIARVAEMLGVSVIPIKAGNPQHKQVFAARKVGAGAVEWMCTLRPHMGIRRRAQIDKALDSYDPGKRRRQRRMTDSEVVEYRKRYLQGESAKNMALEAGVHFTGFYRMLKGETYT